MELPESSGLEVRVDSLLLEGVSAKVRMYETKFNHLPFKFKILRSAEKLKVVVDGKEMSARQVIMKGFSPSLEYRSLPYVSMDIIPLASLGRYLVMPLATFARSFYAAVAPSLGEDAARRFCMPRGLDQQRLESKRVAAGIEVTVKFLTLTTEEGVDYTLPEIDSVHSWILKRLDNPATGVVVLDYGKTAVPTDFKYKYGWMSSTDPSPGEWFYVLTPNNHRSRLQLDSSFVTVTKSAVIELNTNTIVTRGRSSLGQLLQQYPREFSEMHYQLGQKMCATPQELVRAGYARFIGVAPGIQRRDGVITPSYGEPLAEQLQDAEFWGFKAVSELPASTKIKDVLEMPEPLPVKLSFSYKGQLYMPEVKLPQEFGQRLPIS